MRVLDLAPLAGIYATRLLAEQGHDVIRVESPHGDGVRRTGPSLCDEPGLDDGAYHQFFNAGKRSVALDLASVDGREAFARLAATADVIVAPAEAIVEEELRARNPEVILTLLVGHEAPELCTYARSGLLSLTGYPDRAPVIMGGHIIFSATGLWVMLATAAAMLVRQTTGHGQTVTVDVLQCFESYMDNAIENYLARGRAVERTGARGSVTALAGALPCADGYWMLSLMDSVNQWQMLLNWMQDPVLSEDAELRSYPGRVKRREALLDYIGKWAAPLTKLEIVSEAQRRHIPAAPVSTALDLAHDEQLIARRFLIDIDHPEYGRMTFPRGALATIWDHDIAPAPRLGSSNAAILGELGYSHPDATFL